jgi:hypothetical protein
MSNFATAMVSSAKTWNGAVSLSTPDITGETSGRLGLFFKAIRGLNAPRLYEYLRESARENITDVFLLTFHIRDCRGGKGERDLGRRALVWLFLHFPEEFGRVAPLIAEYGRWDDLMELWPGVLDLSDLKRTRENFCANIEDDRALGRLRELQGSFVSIMGRQLVNDRAQMEAGEPITICSKWAPTEKDSVDRKHQTVRTLCTSMGINPMRYRKEYITPMRQYLNIVESYMCSHMWGDIEYSKVPSCAMKRLKKAFEKHSPEQFAAWKTKLQKGEVEVKAKQLYPHELIHEIRAKCGADIVCEAQWKVLEKEAQKLGTLQNALFVCDVSGSMESWCSGFGSGKKPGFIPMDVSIALSLLGANTVQGVFHNHIITFQDHPVFYVVKDGSLYDRVCKLKSAPWGGSTNLQATFDLILMKARSNKLSQEDMPSRIFIISDMQFDSASYSNSGNTNFQVIESKYAKAGYKRPQIVFWNVCGSSTDFPVSVNDHGTALISGFSPSVMKAILNGTDFYPYTILRDTLDAERLKPVRDALLEIDPDMPDLVDASDEE